MPTEGVFVNSNRLPSDAIVEFFTALCKVSRKILLPQEERASARALNSLPLTFDTQPT